MISHVISISLGEAMKARTRKGYSSVQEGGDFNAHSKPSSLRSMGRRAVRMEVFFAVC